VNEKFDTITLRPLLVLKSVNLFDLDVAYSFTDALLELDYLIFAKTPKGIVTILTLEEISRKVEWSKIPQRLLISQAVRGDLWSYGDRIILESIPVLSYTDKIEGTITKENNVLMKMLTKYFTEHLNLYLYSLLILSFKYAKKVFRDLRRVTASNVCFPKSLIVLAENIGRSLTEDISISVDYAKILQRMFKDKRKKLESILNSAELIYAFPQTGMGLYRLKQTIFSLDSIIQRFTYHKNVIVCLNKSINFDIYGGCKGEDCIFYLKKLIIQFSKFPDRYSIICSPNEVKKIAKKNKKALLLLMQDWNKGILGDFIRSIIKHHEDNVLGMIVIPETYYHKMCTNKSGRAITACGGFLRKVCHEEILDILSLKSFFLEKDDIKVIWR